MIILLLDLVYDLGLEIHVDICRVSKPPTTLDELGESLTLWETLNNDKPNIEAKFQPLYDQFAIMEKYEVNLHTKGMLTTFRILLL